MAAENQDQSEVVARKNAVNLRNSPKSESLDQLKELYSLKNDQTPKVRKPYTITKQREKWAEEEHQKFLEALKLYGRGWRQIEEHVGTKTAVQIRSHAQKFFSKVVRESNGGPDSCAKPIEIPPPRPKRKPMHPYPRKLADPVKGGSTPTQTERSKSPNESTGEQENKSPTSVLSPYASEMVSAASEQQNGCSSPTSCTTNMQSTVASPVEKINDYVTTFKATVGEDVFLSATQVSTPQLNDFLTIKLDSAVKDYICANQDENEASPSTSIKLFGQTVNVDSCKHSPSISRNRHGNIEGDNGMVVTSTLKHVDTDLSLGMFTGNFITASGATTNPYVKFFADKSDSVEPVSDASRPRWVIYNGLPYYLSPVDPNIVHAHERSCSEEKMKKEIPTERSCTGSNAGSVTQTENTERNSDSVDSQCQPPVLEAELETRQRNGKGFVPYKRCLAERDVSSAVVAAEEQGRRRTRVCS